MKVILLKDVPKVGQRYDVKNVADGFAMNSLIPRKLAEIATDGALKRVEAAREKIKAEREAELSVLLENFDKIHKSTVTLSAKANDKGHLYATVSADQVAEALRDATGLMIAVSLIDTEPIKAIGTHEVEVKLGDKKALVHVVIEPA